MNDVPVPDGRLRSALLRFGVGSRQLLLLTAALIWSGVCIYVVSPKIVAFLLVGSVVTPGLWWAHRHGRLPRVVVSPSLAILLAFGIYLVINALWSADPSVAFWVVVRHFVFAVALCLTLQLLEDGDPRFAATMLRAFLFAYALMACIVLFEVATDMLLRRVMNTLLPFTQIADKKVLTIENGKVIAIADYLTNRNVAALCFLFWPALYASRYIAGDQRSKMIRWLVLAIVVVAVARSNHASSKAAMTTAALVFALAYVSRVTAWRTIVAGWIVATMLVVPISIAVKTWSGLEHSTLVYSFRHRVVIWGFTAVKVLEKPWLGVGVGSTRILDETERPALGATDDPAMPPSTNVHAHNVYLQAWFELGGVGAIFLLLSGLPLLAWMRRQSDDVFPYLAAAFALGATMAAFSYSFTAPWFLASFGFSAIFMRLAVEAGKPAVTALLQQSVQQLANDADADRTRDAAA